MAGSEHRSDTTLDLHPQYSKGVVLSTELVGSGMLQMLGCRAALTTGSGKCYRVTFSGTLGTLGQLPPKSSSTAAHNDGDSVRALAPDKLVCGRPQPNGADYAIISRASQRASRHGRPSARVGGVKRKLPAAEGRPRRQGSGDTQEGGPASCVGGCGGAPQVSIVSGRHV
jgi:hypothetical protein